MARQKRTSARITGSPDSSAEADARAGAALASRRRMDAARSGRVGRRRDHPHPRLHRQGGGADLYSGAVRAEVTLSKMWVPQLWPGYDESASIWQPVSEIPKFGIWPLVIGTLKVTIVAMLVAVPLGVGAALYVVAVRAPAHARDRQAGRRAAGRHPVGGARLLRAHGHGDLVPEPVPPRVATQRAGLGRGAVVRGHPGDLHAGRGGAARRPAQLRRGVDGARRRALADHAARAAAGGQPRASPPASRWGSAAPSARR